MKTVKTILTLAVALIALKAQAASHPLRFEAEALKVRDEIQNDVTKIQGVNGIGLGGCNDRTGQLDDDRADVYCIVIYTKDEAGARRVQRLYPAKNRIDNVIIQVKVLSEVKIQPRMSGGH